MFFYRSIRKYREIEHNRFKGVDPKWGCSSVGRAVALQAIGQEFDSPQLHQSLEKVGLVAQLVRARA